MGIKYPAWKIVLICSLWYFLLLRLAVAIALVLILKPNEQFTEQRNERTIILTGFVLISKRVIFNEPKLNSCFGCCFLFVQNASIGSNSG